MVKRSLGILVGGALAACNVSAAPASSGGVNLDGGAAEGGDASAARICPSALVVANSDFTSTSVSVLSPAGAVLSASIISSSSAPSGLTTPLSGDVVLPSEPTPGEIVLIDRFPNSVVTWVDPATAAVRHQLQVGTGFSANPHDYLEISPTKAYVTRYELNPSPGKQANDGGGDLLVIDPKTPSITGRVPFAVDAFPPRPGRMVRVGSEAWVSLERFNADFTGAGDARLVGVSTATDAIAWTLDLPGVASCGGIAVAPSGKVVALACGGASSDADPTKRSALVLVDATAHPPVELKRFPAAVMLGAPLDSILAYASEGLLVGVAVGDSQAKRNDAFYSLDLASGKAQIVVDGGMPFVLGDVRCAPGCSDLCFLADANAGALRVWKASGTSLTAQASVPVDPAVALPRYLGGI
jgi:hypothetical protein